MMNMISFGYETPSLIQGTLLIFRPNDTRPYLYDHWIIELQVTSDFAKRMAHSAKRLEVGGSLRLRVFF